MYIEYNCGDCNWDSDKDKQDPIFVRPKIKKRSILVKPTVRRPYYKCPCCGNRLVVSWDEQNDHNERD